MAFFLENSAEAIISIYATLKAGGIFVMLNGSLRPKKLGGILEDSGARFLIAHTGKAAAVNAALSDRTERLTGKLCWQKREGGKPVEQDAQRRGRGKLRNADEI